MRLEACSGKSFYLDFIPITTFENDQGEAGEEVHDTSLVTDGIEHAEQEDEVEIRWLEPSLPCVRRIQVHFSKDALIESALAICLAEARINGSESTPRDEAALPSFRSQMGRRPMLQPRSSVRSPLKSAAPRSRSQRCSQGFSQAVSGLLQRASNKQQAHRVFCACALSYLPGTR